MACNGLSSGSLHWFAVSATAATCEQHVAGAYPLKSCMESTCVRHVENATKTSVLPFICPLGNEWNRIEKNYTLEHVGNMTKGIDLNAHEPLSDLEKVHLISPMGSHTLMESFDEACIQWRHHWNSMCRCEVVELYCVTVERRYDVIDDDYIVRQLRGPLLRRLRRANVNFSMAT